MSSTQQPKLSLLAQFDDFTRMVEILTSDDNLNEQVEFLLHNCEKQRLLWLSEHIELSQVKQECDQQSIKTKSLESKLKHTREAFKRELNMRERIQDEYDQLLKKLNQVQNYLRDDEPSKEDLTSLKETILSSLNLHKLTTVIEENSNEKSSSLSGIEFDKTDEDVIDDNFVQTDQAPIKQPTKQGVFANEDQFDDFSMLNDTITIAEDAMTPIQQPKKNTPSTRSMASVNSRRSNLSETLMRQRQSNLPSDLNVDNRPHQFITKKVFKPEKCGPCGQSIGFCASCYHCRDCKAICHLACKDRVPLPCIPYVSRANIGKQGRLVLISDFIPSNCKPCVPALIVHCTSEVEKRGLKQVGIYRVPGPEREVKELKEKILKSKHGIPSLAATEIHVLCNVVKKFLLQLDEALIIRISWRDFVGIAKVENDEERRTRFKEAIMNLPNANRDTLAFLMLHLRRVAQYPENKMTILNLSKMFGPSVLGYSIRDPPVLQIAVENAKQQQVVECLLNLDDDFWQSMLHLDNQMNYSILNPSDFSIHLSPEQFKGRPSIGARLCGGTVNSGMITPLRNKKKTNRSYKLKPLFHE